MRFDELEFARNADKEYRGFAQNALDALQNNNDYNLRQEISLERGYYNACINLVSCIVDHGDCEKRRLENYVVSNHNIFGKILNE